MELFTCRQKHVEEHLLKHYDLLKEYEDALRVEDDPQRRAKLKRQIEDIKNQIQTHCIELTELKRDIESSLVGGFHRNRLLNVAQNEQIQLGTSDLPVSFDGPVSRFGQQSLTLTPDSLFSYAAPPPPEGFVGYREDFTRLLRAVEETGLIAVTGVLGIGKTMLLRKLAAAFDQSFIFWHEFNPGLASLDDVLKRLARFFDARLGNSTLSRAMNLPELSPQDKVRLLAGELNKGGGYLFFDRFELVEDDAALTGFFTVLKGRKGKGTVILASRSRPSFIRPLDEARNVAQVIELRGLSDEETIEYLGNKRVCLSEEGASHLNRVFDGLPLALELLVTLMEEEEGEPELLARADAVREQVIEQLFEELYTRFSHTEKELLTTAALFRLPFKKKRLLGAHYVLFDRSASADYVSLRKHCLTSDSASGYHQVHEVVSAMALSNASVDLNKLRLKLADHLLSDSPDDYTAYLEALLLFKAADNWERAAEVACELIDRRFIPYAPDMAENILNLFTENAVSRECWMWLLGAKGLVAHCLRQNDKSEAYYTEMLKLAEELEDKAGEALALQRLGVLHNAKGNGVLSEKYYRRSLTLKIELGDEEGQAQIYNNLGSIYSSRGEFEKASEKLQKGLELRRRMNSPEWLYLALYSNLGVLYAEQGLWEEAFEYSTRALRIAEEMQSPYDIGKSLYNLGKHEHERGDIDAAREKYLGAMEIADCYGIDELDELVSIALGRLSYGTEDFELAISYFSRVATIYEKFDQKESLAMIYFDIGTFHREKGDYSVALDWYLKGIELFEHFTDEQKVVLYLQNIRVMAGTLWEKADGRKLLRALKGSKNRLAAQGISFTLAMVYGALSHVYSTSLGRMRVATCCLRHEISLLKELGRDRARAEAMIALGNDLEAAGQYGDALAVIDETLETAASCDFKDLLRAALYNRGNCYIELELYAQAEEDYQRAKQLSLEAEDVSLLQMVRHNLSEVIRRQGRLEEAVKLLDEVLLCARSDSDHSGVVSTLNNLGLAYEEMGKMTDALSCWYEAVSIGRLHGLKRDEANTLISIGNLYLVSDQPTEAKDYYEQALSAARAGGDIDLEESCILSLAHAHRKLGTFQAIEEEFKATAERADKSGHYEKVIKFLTLGGEVNLDENEPEASAVMFEQALLFAFWRAVKLTEQFTNRKEAPSADNEASYVIRRILVSVEQSYESGKVLAARSVVESLVNKLMERGCFGDDFPINFLKLIEEFFTTRPSESMSKFVFERFKSQSRA